MDITLQYFDGCPSWRVADERLQDAVRNAAGDHRISYQKVETEEEAERARFRGSPTILFDGLDPFAAHDAPFGLSCRIFQTETGPQGAPSLSQLEGILES
ncbi:MAG: thioredoxin family protein [Acidimicrobiales bacterium]